MRRSHRWLIPLLLLTTGLGLRGLNADMLWWDEIFTLRVVGGGLYGPLSLPDVWTNSLTDIWNPPAYYLLLNLWGQVSGWTPFAVRSLSLFVGLLAVAWTFGLGQSVGGDWVGLGAATALGLSAVFIWYTHELRTYTLLVLLTVMCVWSYWRLITARPSRWLQALFLFSVAGLAYTLYFAVLVVAMIAVYHLLFMPKNRAWWRVPGLMLLAAILTLPWFVTAVRALASATSNPDYLGALALSDGEVLTMLGIAFSNGLVPLLLLPVFALLIVRQQPGARYVAFLTVTVLALSLLLHHLVPLIRHIRHILMLWPLLAVMTGFGAAYVARQRRMAVFALILVVWTMTGIWGSVTPDLNDYVFREVHLKFFRLHLPMHTLGEVINAQSHPDDAVIFAAPVEAWAVAGAFEYYVDPAPVRYTMADQLPGDVDEYPEQARRFMADRLRVWLGVERNMPPDYRQAALEQILNAEFVQCRRELAFTDLTLDLYAQRLACCGVPTAPPQMTFGDVQLSYMDSLPVSTATAELDLIMAWNLPESVPRNTYSAALHVWDEADMIVAQYDGGLPNADYSCQMAQVPLTELPAGDYRLTLSVYNWATGERLDGPAGDSHLLGTFTRIIDQDQP